VLSHRSRCWFTVTVACAFAPSLKTSLRKAEAERGISPYKYVLQQRVERAKQLLKDEESAIVDIAIECGFANQTHLNKHFRSFTGVTPRIYRSRG
jgi:AraC family transcriptional regulator